jgi:4-hydroxy-3-polyprenylbenzoate decarboxylase
MNTGRLVVGVTGASGAIYALRFLHHAKSHFREIYLITSDQAHQVAQTELGVDLDKLDGVIHLDRKNYFTPPASGSFRHDGMVVVPCSMGTLGRIANGVSDDLITRSADVCLKERRPLILVPRETPYSTVMIRNMLAASEAGAIILPASPAWYYRPKSFEELADTVAARILQNLGVEQDIVRQWQRE